MSKSGPTVLAPVGLPAIRDETTMTECVLRRCFLRARRGSCLGFTDGFWTFRVPCAHRRRLGLPCFWLGKRGWCLAPLLVWPACRCTGDIAVMFMHGWGVRGWSVGPGDRLCAARHRKCPGVERLHDAPPRDHQRSRSSVQCVHGRGCVCSSWSTTRTRTRTRAFSKRSRARDLTRCSKTLTRLTLGRHERPRLDPQIHARRETAAHPEPRHRRYAPPLALCARIRHRRHRADQRRHAVEHRVRQLEEWLAVALDNFRLHQEALISRIPKVVRGVTMGEFADKYNGDIQACLRGLQSERMGGTDFEIDKDTRKRKWAAAQEEAEASGQGDQARAPKNGEMSSTPRWPDVDRVFSACDGCHAEKDHRGALTGRQPHARHAPNDDGTSPCRETLPESPQAQQTTFGCPRPRDITGQTKRHHPTDPSTLERDLQPNDATPESTHIPHPPCAPTRRKHAQRQRLPARQSIYPRTGLVHPGRRRGRGGRIPSARKRQGKAGRPSTAENAAACQQHRHPTRSVRHPRLLILILVPFVRNPTSTSGKWHARPRQLANTTSCFSCRQLTHTRPPVLRQCTRALGLRLCPRIYTHQRRPPPRIRPARDLPTRARYVGRYHGERQEAGQGGDGTARQRGGAKVGNRVDGGEGGPHAFIYGHWTRFPLF